MSWDGTSWCTVNSLSTALYQIAGGVGGNNQNAIQFSGYNGSSGVNNTEEWAFSGLPPSTPAADYSDAIIGQMYYNSSTGSFKAIKDGLASGTW